MLKFDLRDPLTAEVMAAKMQAAMAFSPLVRPKMIAKECGVTPQAVSGWKKTGRMSKKHIRKMASIMGIALEWWMDNDPSSPPIPADPTTPPPRAHIVQEHLPFYGNSSSTSRLVAAFAKLSTADQERYLAEIEALGAKTQALVEEFRRRDSPMAAAFGAAVPDHEVERKMKLRHDRG